jgi:nucleoside recognition membrane protein YjiH
MTSTLQLPVLTLTVLGAVVAVLGLFAAGELAVVALGLGAVAFAGLLAVLGTRRA